LILLYTVMDVHRPPVFKFHVMQLNYIKIVRYKIRASGLGSSHFYAEGRAGGRAPSFGDAHNFESLMFPLDRPRLLGIGVAGITFNAYRNAHSS
jgi:hypothetical protein